MTKTEKEYTKQKESFTNGGRLKEAAKSYIPMTATGKKPAVIKDTETQQHSMTNTVM